MIDDKLIERLKAEHGEVHLLEHDGIEVVVKPAVRPEWKRFNEMRGDPARKVGAAEQLLRDCCVFPDAAGLAAILARKPGLAETFGGECAEISGLTNKVTSRKL